MPKETNLTWNNQYIYPFSMSKYHSGLRNFCFTLKLPLKRLSVFFFMELNDLRKKKLRKIYVWVERISVYKVIENLVEHGRHCLPCSTKFSMTL